MNEEKKSVLLDAVGTAQERIRQGELDLVRAVAAARNGGVTWQAIADRLGRAQPNVYRTFAPLLQKTGSVQVAVRGDVEQLLEERRRRSTT
jgi:isopropylmalate/homocitrate/citramalate synthase